MLIMKIVSVVIPVYYNEGSLLPLLKELQEVEAKLKEQNLGLQLIFIDDGSGDSSFEKLKKIKEERPETTIIRLTRNFGAVNASKTGLQYVVGDCFMLLAADLQDPPSIIVEMATLWQAGNSYVIAVRKEREDPLFTRIYASIYYWLLRNLVVANYPQGGFDMFMLDKKALDHMKYSAKDINPSLLSYWLGFKPVIIHYNRRKREYGKSRWTFIKKVKFLLDSLLGFSVLPLRIISLLGAIVSIISFGYGSAVVFGALIGKQTVEGFPTLVALITFILGLIIIMLGIIGEYLWRISAELNRRPDAIISEVL
jgi:polyisoprenyl-phosphate glycosyltransferase